MTGKLPANLVDQHNRPRQKFRALESQWATHEKRYFSPNITNPERVNLNFFLVGTTLLVPLKWIIAETKRRVNRQLKSQVQQFQRCEVSSFHSIDSVCTNFHTACQALPCRGSFVILKRVSNGGSDCECTTSPSEDHLPVITIRETRWSSTLPKRLLDDNSIHNESQHWKLPVTLLPLVSVSPCQVPVFSFP